MSSFQDFTPLGFIRFHTVVSDLSLVLRQSRLTTNSFPLRRRQPASGVAGTPS
jgi:hypothetical protein